MMDKRMAVLVFLALLSLSLIGSFPLTFVSTSFTVSEDPDFFTVENDYYIAKLARSNGGIAQFYIKPQVDVNIVAKQTFTFLGGHELNIRNGTYDACFAQWEPWSADNFEFSIVYESSEMVIFRTEWRQGSQPGTARFRLTEYKTFYANQQYYLVSYTRFYDEPTLEVDNDDLCFLFDHRLFWKRTDENPYFYMINRTGQPQYGYRYRSHLFESNVYQTLPWCWVYNTTLNVGFGVILLEAFPRAYETFLGTVADTSAYTEFQITHSLAGQINGTSATVSYIGVADGTINYYYIQNLAKQLFINKPNFIPDLRSGLILNDYNPQRVWSRVGNAWAHVWQANDLIYVFGRHWVGQPEWQLPFNLYFRFSNATSSYYAWEWKDVSVADYFWNESYIRLKWVMPYLSRLNWSLQFEFWDDSDTFVMEYGLKTTAPVNLSNAFVGLKANGGDTEICWKTTHNPSFLKVNTTDEFCSAIKDEGYMFKNLTSNKRILSGYRVEIFFVSNSQQIQYGSGQEWTIQHQIQYFRIYDYENKDYFDVSDFKAPNEHHCDILRFNKHYWLPLPLFEQQHNMSILRVGQTRAQVAYSEITGETLKLIIIGDNETTSTTKIYCGDKGEPLNVEGATSWSYDNATNILTIIIAHYSVQNVEVYWPILGDIDGDGTVNINDLALLNQAYGSTPTSLNWNPDADLNKDNVINVLDLYLLGKKTEN